MQKANHARGYATSYDEYQGVMKEMFKIDVRVENKNISYAYPGDQKRVIRGKRLGRNFDKEGLEGAFANNDRMFATRPELRAELRAGLATLSPGKGAILRDPGGVLLEPGGARTIFTKDYGAFTLAARPGRGRGGTPELDLSGSIIPVDEIRRGKRSLFDYCKNNKIALTTDDNGQTVMKGRKHVIVSEFEFTNTHNKIAGSLIDFVAIHKQLTYVQALSKINDNPRLLLLEQNWGERKRSFNAFYVPKPEQQERAPATATLTRLFQTFGASHHAAGALIDRNQAHVSKSGLVRIFVEDDGSGALEFSEDAQGRWKEQRHGKARRPFYSSKPNGSSVHVFPDAKDFLARHGEHAFAGANRPNGIIALLTPDPEPIDHYLNEHKQVSRLLFAAPKSAMSQSDLDFFGLLKKRYQHLGVEIAHSSRGPDLSRGGLELDLPF